MIILISAYKIIKAMINIINLVNEINFFAFYQIMIKAIITIILTKAKKLMIIIQRLLKMRKKKI